MSKPSVASPHSPGSHGPERTESGLQAAVRPDVTAQRVSEVRPTALELEAMRREVAESRRVREALERRALQGEQRANESELRAAASERRELEAREALERSVRDHEKSEASWSAWFSSTEGFVAQALGDRDEATRSLTETLHTLEGARSDVTHARAALERERGRAADLMRERDEARTELGRARGEALQLGTRVDSLGKELDRDKKTAALLDRARERIASLEEELERAQTECAAAVARIADSARQTDSERSQLSALRGEVATLEVARAAAEEQLERSMRVVRHLLAVHQKDRSKRGSADGTDQATLRLCNAIIATQDRRIDILEQIVAGGAEASEPLIAESRRLGLELGILLAQLQRVPTSKH